MAESWKNQLKKTLETLLFFVCSFVLSFVLYVLVKPLDGDYSVAAGTFGKAAGALLLALVVGYGAFLKARGKLTFEKKEFLILLLAFVIHLTYMLVTDGYTRQHDTWGAGGHYDYALVFYETGRLPAGSLTASTIYQFYHPPLNAFLEGTWMHVFQALCWDPALAAKPELLFASCSLLDDLDMLIASYVLIQFANLKELKLSERGRLLLVAFLALFPRLTELSGQLNNDAPSILFSLLAVYFAFRWLKEGQRWRDLLGLSLAVGFALFAKLSAISLCFGLAVVFLIQFVRSLQGREGALPWKTLSLQYLSFLAIVLPLGLWWTFYTHFVYGLPYFFVFNSLPASLFTGSRTYALTLTSTSISVWDANNGGLVYTSAFVNALARFFLPFWPSDVAANPLFCSPYNNYNILTYALKSSIFGEFSYTFGQGFGILALGAEFVLWFALLVSLVWRWAKKLEWGNAMTFALYLAGGMILAYLYLQISMPYGCSMDFRYIVPLIMPLGFLLVKNQEDLSLSRGRPFEKILGGTLRYGTILFIGASYLFYLIAI